MRGLDAAGPIDQVSRRFVLFEVMFGKQSERCLTDKGMEIPGDQPFAE
jgi:hypothetical protein